MIISFQLFVNKFLRYKLLSAGLEEGTWDWSGKTYEVPGVDLDLCDGGRR